MGKGGAGGLVGMGIILFIIIVVAALGPSLFYSANQGVDMNGSPYGNLSNQTNQFILVGLTLNQGLLLIVGAAFILFAIGALLSGGKF